MTPELGADDVIVVGIQEWNRLLADNLRMHLLYEIQPPEKNAVELMFLYKAALEEVRDHPSMARDIADRALDGEQPSV